MEVDKSNLREVILNSVKQMNVAPEFYNQLNLNRRAFDKIVLCGMGGSAFIGDIFSFLKQHSYAPLIVKLPVFIYRSYGLPNSADQNTLVVCVSYSGNTEEPLSAYEKARQNNLEIAAVACGGKLAELCQKNKTPWIKIPETLQPRFSTGYQLTALIKIFMAYGLLDSAANNDLADLPQKVIPAQIELQAKSLCLNLNRKIPVIYSSDKNWALARIWKIKFNENAKIPAFWNVFPELNHNEMVGWTNALGPFHFLFLKDPDDLPRIQKRMQLTAEMLRQRGLNSNFITIGGSNPLEKLFWAMAFGDWLSYHLALFYGIDPTPVDMVEEFKKQLNN